MDCDFGDLGDCLRRVLLSSAGESDRPLPVQRRPVENHSRGHYPGSVLRVLSCLSEGRIEMDYLAGFGLMVGAVFLIFKKW